MNPDDPRVDEIIRRQLTPTVVPLLERLQQAQLHAGNTVAAARHAETKQREVNLLLLETTEKFEMLIQQQATLERVVRDLEIRSGRMMAIRPEPSEFWWGLFLGVVLASCLWVGMINYIEAVT
ncbi:MAG TPA: hypothetical protein VGD88_04520 [Opitutaceae bacterium]